MNKTPRPTAPRKERTLTVSIEDCLPEELRLLFAEGVRNRVVEESTEAALREHEEGGDARRRDRRAAQELLEELVDLPDAVARRKIKRSRGRFYSPYLVLELAQRAGRVAPADAPECLRLAALARLVLKRLPARLRSAFRLCWWADLLGMLHYEEANALRILRRWEEARLAFRRARAWLKMGSGAVDLQARYASWLGSFFWSREHPWRATLAFRHASKIYQEIGDLPKLGKVQLQQAGLLDSQGRSRDAIALQRIALVHLSKESEPFDAVSASTNLAEMMQRAGETSRALSVLSETRPILEALPYGRPLGVWYWVRGRCRITSGTLDGESDLLAAWRILEPIGDTYSLGLVAADLCRHYLDRCDLQELEHWVGPMVRCLEQHAPSPLVARELARLKGSVAKLTLNAAQVGQILERIVEAMSHKDQR